MAPASCSLDEDGLRTQLGRYRQAGSGAELLASDARHFRVRVGASTDDESIEGLIAVERECCPFFTLGWDPGSRELSVGVSTAEHEPALDAIAYALGVERTG